MFRRRYTVCHRLCDPYGHLSSLFLGTGTIFLSLLFCICMIIICHTIQSQSFTIHNTFLHRPIRPSGHTCRPPHCLDVKNISCHLYNELLFTVNLF